jgi:hypothetical protein
MERWPLRMVHILLRSCHWRMLVNALGKVLIVLLDTIISLLEQVVPLLLQLSKI